MLIFMTACAPCRCKHTQNAPYCDGSHRKPEALTAYNRQLLQANSTYKEAILKVCKAHGYPLALMQVLGAFIACYICYDLTNADWSLYMRTTSLVTDGRRPEEVQARACCTRGGGRCSRLEVSTQITAHMPDCMPACLILVPTVAVHIQTPNAHYSTILVTSIL